MIVDTFIRRPILASVCSLVIILAGAMSIPTLSIAQGALSPWANSSSSYYELLTEAIAERYGVDLELPWQHHLEPR